MKIINLIKQERALTLFIILSSLIFIFAFGIRLVNLTRIPVFADEAIYVRWSQVMRAESTLRFLPLSDGKEPLFMWITIPFLKLFSDPLFAGRFVSVLSGMGTSLGIFTLSYLCFKSKKAALLSLLLYSLSPFAFFFHRMALVDSMLSFFEIWVAVGGLVTVRFLRLDAAMLTGFALGGAWLTKSPALFFALLLPLSLLFLKKLNIKTGAFALFLLLISIGMGYGFYNILRLGPNFSLISSRNLDYVFPYSHVLTNPRDPFIFLVDRAIEWLWILGPAPILLLAVSGVLAFLKKYPKEIIFLLILFAFPLLVEAEFAKVFTARYIFFILPPLFVLSGLPALFVKKWKAFTIFVVFIFSILSLINIYYLITNPIKASIPQSERSGYLGEWTAGNGIKEIADYIKAEHSKNPSKQIIVGTEGFFGTLPDGLQIYLEKIPNITVIGTGLNFTDVPEQLKEAKKAGDEVYFVVNKSRINLNKDFSEFGLTMLAQYDKASRLVGTREFIQLGDHETLYFFKVN